MSQQNALPERRKREYHGMCGTRTYNIWCGIVSRCTIPSAKGFENYGGRGIKVCARWSRFSAFYEDMGEVPHGGSIDRIDSNGDYEPANCRWATRVEQNRNQRDLMYLSFRGKTQCAAAWAEELGVSYCAIRARIRRGWDVERTLSNQIRKHKPYERTST